MNYFQQKHAHKIRAYARAPCFTALLPWLDYSDEAQCMLLDDGVSVGACFEITPLPCEARLPEYLTHFAERLTRVLEQAIPQDKRAPWIVQCYVQDKLLSAVSHTATASDPTATVDNFSKLKTDYDKTIATHLAALSHKAGYFLDHTVTGQPFIARERCIRLVLYRRVAPLQLSRKDAIAALQQTTRRLTQQLEAIGIQVNRLDGADVYAWLSGWFNPLNTPEKRGIALDNDAASDATLKASAMIPRRTFAERLFFSSPTSFDKGWLFDGQAHQVITLKGLARPPVIGQLSLERQHADQCYAVLDRLPLGTIFCMTFVVQHQDHVKAHLERIEKSVIGGHADAKIRREQLRLADSQLAQGHALYPCVFNLYVNAEDTSALAQQVQTIDTLLTTHGFSIVPEDDECYPIDAYLRYLPMNYAYEFDKKYHYRTQYVLTPTIAHCLPFYGRTTGTQTPGIPFFNRGGNYWPWDPLRDKTKNSHLLVLGETGTGKSNLLMLMLLQMLTYHKARIVLIEAGGSFDLFAQYLKAQGLSVNHVKLDSAHPVSLNPFAEGLKLLDNDKSEARDLLSEMVLAALVMITGGEAKERDKFERRDNQLIIDALLMAAKAAKEAGRAQFVAQDIVVALKQIAKGLDTTSELPKIQRARDMADSLQYFCADPVSNAFFNSEGHPWPLADVTIVDMGLFAKSGYEAGRAVAFAGCIQKVLSLAEQNQASGRPIIAAFDENHLFTKIPLLAELQTTIAKMGRKLGLGLWALTQNLRDFADEAHKMLSLMEHFICLALPPDEIDQIEKFRTLTATQRALLLSAKKSRGQYTEGVLLSPQLTGLFRNIPPPLYLCLAATDPDEKHKRREVMEARECSELEAVMWLAVQHASSA